MLYCTENHLYGVYGICPYSLFERFLSARHFEIFWTKAVTVAGNSKSCLKSGFMGSCVAGCPEFGTSRGAPGPSRIREADPRGRGVRSSEVKCCG